ncbi:hypothetical protein C5167_035365 [Papaver somniferum]|uniref:Uncharacterized protein n=1 Tax=Papaver somniferum TaxID=3469 RepID=A0A4Y7KII9_PAPSO|nr:hypothetical protein C5167_035365 [Papaver somniferum]
MGLPVVFTKDKLKLLLLFLAEISMATVAGMARFLTVTKKKTTPEIELPSTSRMDAANKMRLSRENNIRRVKEMNDNTAAAAAAAAYPLG